MAQPATLEALLMHGRADDVALGAPGRPGLTYGALRALIAQTRASLHAWGLGAGDRIALVLPNGPEMAAAFLTVASTATTAPLNPAYRADEFAFYLDDLQARALVVLEGQEGPAREVARERNLPLIELSSSADGPAGHFTLKSDLPRTNPPRREEETTGSDVALVLHTSGTTARPKLVPLTHANLTASARHIGAHLALGPSDTCLNIMPLFHIHGLVAAVLSSLGAGSRVVCTPGFNALRFFSWFEEARPSWYTAVPTMHQALVERARRNAERLTTHRLRFIRSSSASLPPQVMEELERVFGVPVIESYGMTEAAHQMASSPLPPRPRYAGAVGIAAGPEVAIMDEAGALLPPGALGEVVIRGPNVMSGYVNNPEANARAFTHGWFRTGDQGTLDTDGYLRLTGRLKELINRGGEKVSPLEVDTVLLDHPAVQQAVTFALPHPKLGEDVAAAVVLREGVGATERELRDFMASRVADFKVPRRIVILTELPKGPTGKVQRIGLAERLGLTS
ncbi:acyl--CoA ligase [Corallococcus llansteffanensis]|uniref:AMP-dependent synthetase n=1 Tax=Corallococcus llansteffanensis TaxID=2316731 RepID=A0A3A8QHC9_9BACT|nr:acyl--CoA ligase [Corallococcus llansteffanensis]RKH67368.1 AMP-dependent synthetase [Corallococcus llansteffanensis]